MNATQARQLKQGTAVRFTGKDGASRLCEVVCFIPAFAAMMFKEDRVKLDTLRGWDGRWVYATLDQIEAVAVAA